MHWVLGFISVFNTLFLFSFVLRFFYVWLYCSLLLMPYVLEHSNAQHTVLAMSCIQKNRRIYAVTLDRRRQHTLTAWRRQQLLGYRARTLRKQKREGTVCQGNRHSIEAEERAPMRKYNYKMYGLTELWSGCYKGTRERMSGSGAKCIMSSCCLCHVSSEGGRVDWSHLVHLA